MRQRIAPEYVAGLLTACWLVRDAALSWGQAIPLPTVPSPPCQPIRIPRVLEQQLVEAEELLQRSELTTAIRRLQSVLDHPEDYFLEGTTQSMKQRARELLRSLPPEAQRLYELEVANSLPSLLAQARRQRDSAALHAAVARFGACRGRDEALLLWGTEAFDRGEMLLAAWLLSLISQREVSPTLRLQRSLAWEAVGWPVPEDDRRSLTHVETIRIQNRPWPAPASDQPLLLWWQQQARQPLGLAAHELLDWLVSRGSPAGAHLCALTPPIGPRAWMVNPTDALVWDSVEDQPRWQATPTLQRAVQELWEGLLLDDKLPLASSLPLVVGDVVVYRGVQGLVAVHRGTGEPLWRSVDTQSWLETWISQGWGQVEQTPREAPINMVSPQSIARRQVRDLLFRDLTWGSLSSDGQHVFAISPVPPPPAPRPAPAAGVQVVAPPWAVQASTPVNKMQVYEVHGGRLLQEWGGAREAGEQVSSTAGRYFLGPPVPWQQRCYVLLEQQGVIELREWQRTASGLYETTWVQPLAAAPDGMHEGSSRHGAGLMPVPHGPWLICATAAGAVVAVDVVQRQLQWWYTYPTTETTRDLPANQLVILRQHGMVPPGLGEDVERWLDSNPVTVGPWVILTPRDSTELHCLELETGKLLWKRPREDGLYVAGFIRSEESEVPQAVVIAGRYQWQAYALTDGQPVWAESLSLPPPSGRGLDFGSQMLQPLASGELALIDLREGRTVLRIPWRDSHPPGHLVAARGSLLTFHWLSLSAYHPQQYSLAQVEARLQQNPQDAEAQGWRGLWRLYQRDRVGGLQDLLAARRLQSSPQFDDIMASLVIDSLRDHFADYRHLAEEWESWQLEPSLRNTLRLRYAQALAARGEHLSALHQYLKLTDTSAAVAHASPRLVRMADQRLLREDLAFRDDLRRWYYTVPADERQQLDAAIAQHYSLQDHTAQASRFLHDFDWHPLAADIQQRWILSLMQRNPTQGLQELTKCLASSDFSPRVFAAWQLAMFCQQQQHPQTGAWLRLMHTQLGYALLPSGQTARQWVEQQPDSRWQHDDPWPTTLPHIVRRQRQPLLQRYRWVEWTGPPDPRFEHWSAAISYDNDLHLVFYDAAGELRWQLPIPSEGDPPTLRHLYPNASPRLFVSGTWLLLNLGPKIVVWQLAPLADAAPQLAWQRLLSQRSLVELLTTLSRPMILPNGRRRMLPPQGRHGFETAAQLLGLTPSQVLTWEDQRLTAYDPTNGQLLWQRTLATPSSHFETAPGPEVLALLDVERGQAQLYDPRDGSVLGQRAIPPSDDWLWFYDRWLLTMQQQGHLCRLKLVDLLHEQVVWTHELPRSAACRPMSSLELLAVTADGLVEARHLLTGQLHWRAQLPHLGAVEMVWARRYAQRCELIIKQPSPHQFLRIVPYDMNHVPLQGTALALELPSGKLLWQQELKAATWDIFYPENSPVLAFVARLDLRARPQAAGLPLNQFQALFLDGRSGEVLYETVETALPSMYQWQFDGTARKMVANFWNWTLEFDWQSPPTDKPDPQP